MLTVLGTRLLISCYSSKETIVERLKLYSIDKSETLQRIISLIQFDVQTINLKTELVKR
jgi:hypothetical protein